MQLPELYRRGVVRPLDGVAREQLICNFVTLSIRCEWLPILGSSHFGAIWESGILQAIGAACNIQISDFEEAILEVGDLENAIVAIERCQTGAVDDAVSRFAESLKALLEDAMESAMPVFFVL